jgi:hypothetical protein
MGSTTLAIHNNRAERIDYTPIKFFWTFYCELGRWRRCYSWSYD